MRICIRARNKWSCSRNSLKRQRSWRIVPEFVLVCYTVTNERIRILCGSA